MKYYCFSCGQPTEYTIAKPKFCSSCGTNFESKAQTNAQPTLAKPPTPQLSTARVDDDDDDGPSLQDAKEVPNINKLDVEVNIGKKSGEKLGNILGTASTNDYVQSPEPKGKKVSRKKFLEEFKKEAGTLRQR